MKTKFPIQKKQRMRFAGYLITWQRDRYVKSLYHVRALDRDGVLRCTTTMDREPGKVAVQRITDRLQNKG